MNDKKQMSLADIAKVKYPLVYEASLDIEGAGLKTVHRVLAEIMNNYDMPFFDKEYTTEEAMAIIEKHLEARYDV